MSVRRSVVWAFSGQAVSFAASFIGLVVVSRLLSPGEMGIYAVALATVGILQVFAAFGIGSYVVREKELAPGDFDAACTVNAILSTILAVIVFAASFLAARFLDEPRIAPVLQLLALGPIISIPEFGPSAMLQREMRFKLISLAAAVRAVGGTALTIGTALLGMSYYSLVAGNLFSALLGTILICGLERVHSRWRFSLRGWRTIVAFGLRMMSIGGVSILAMRLSEIILGKMLGLAALGVYSRASALAMMIFQNIYGTGTKVAFAKLAADLREHGSMRLSYLGSLRLITAILWPVLIGLAVLSQPAVDILFGEQWRAAAIPLSLLMVALFFGLCFALNWEVFVLRGEVQRQTRYEVIRSILGVALFSAGAVISINAATLGRVLDAFIGALLYLPHMRRLTGSSGRDIGSIYGESALLTLASIIPSLILMIRFDWSPETPPALVAASVALGGLMWLTALRVMRHPLFDEFRFFASKLQRN